MNYDLDVTTPHGYRAYGPVNGTYRTEDPTGAPLPDVNGHYRFGYAEDARDLVREYDPT